MPRFALALLAVLLAVPVASGQAADSLDVTFRFLPDLTASAPAPVVRAFVPGSFNGWGPNTNGRIVAGAPSQATYDADLEEYRYTVRLEIGGRGNVSDPAGGYTYKIHVHENEAGSAYTWLTDPLGAETFGSNNDSVIRVTDPMAFQVAREPNASGQVAAVSAGIFGSESITSVTFTVNEEVYTEGVVDTGDGIYRLVLPAPVPAGSFVRVEATDALGRTASAETGTIPPTVTDAPVPEGLEDGITYDPADPTRAWLVLRAPGKQYVYALGDFNDWTVSDDALMFRDDADPLGTRWWIELTGLAPGSEPAFQYLVDGQIRVADPYTSKVYYPWEAAYPDGAVDYAVGVLTPGAAAFAWTDGDYEAPAQEDLVIYELLVRDFVRDHSFTALEDTLDYLERLGVNAIELMPVAEYDGDESWGYNPAFHLALDKHYGTPDELKSLVDAAHARGMAVILDVVYNHATGQSPLVRLYNQGDYGPPTPENPWANVEARHPFNVFNDLDHTSPLTQLWLDKANRFWADEYHVDGYRFDLTGGFYQTPPLGDFYQSYFAYNPERIGILTRMMDALWTTNPDTYVILEHLVENGQEWRELAAHRGPEDARPGPLLWHNMNRPYSQSAMGYPTATDFASALTDTYTPNWAGGIPVPNAVTYMESHDEQWMMYRNRTFGNASQAGNGYNVRDLFTALNRQRLAGVFFLTVPGPRMLWQFGEVGYGGGPGECLRPDDCPSGTPDRVGNKPIRWDYWSGDAPPFRNGFGGTLTAADAFERAERREVYATWAALLDLRQSYEIFRSAETEVVTRLGLVPDRWLRLSLPDAPAGEPTEAVVFGNFGVAEQTVTLSFSEARTWYDYFDDTEVSLPAGEHVVTLRPGEYHVWTDTDVPSPPGNLGAVADEARPDEAPAAGLQAVFPNPTARAATVRFSLAAAGPARLDVFDALGRRVATLADGPFPAGPQEVALDASALPTGVYVVRLATAAGAETARLTVAR